MDGHEGEGLAKPSNPTTSKSMNQFCSPMCKYTHERGWLTKLKNDNFF